MKTHSKTIKHVFLLFCLLGDLAVTIVKGPLGVFVGIVYGFVAGIFLWYIPSKDSVSNDY